MRRALAVLVAGAALLGACADDDDAADDTAGTTTTTEAPTTATVADSTTTIAVAEPEPIGDALAVGADPADAAQAFLDVYFPGSGATVGEFRQGDSRSGEIDVLRPTEGGGVGLAASTLLVRRSGDTWSVLAAVNPNVTIEEPSPGAELPRGAGPITVSGIGRGFEATLVVRVVDREGGETVANTIAMGGAQADPEPYATQLDLSGCACTGRPLAIVVAGGTGLELDTGEFAAIPVTVEV